ncbi:acetylcholine receptor subunit alpha-1-B-like [Mytilus trossulus]|uniref:acetylcholine receptor subunit alpha-1-B-like n=1 Tax=Mytilus trossulus TaxID=6551 RepID=UPI003007045E
MCKDAFKILCFMFILCGFHYKAWQITDAKKLRSHLLDGYVKDIFPIQNETDSLNLHIFFHLFSIDSFNEVEGRIIVTAALRIIWKDPSLSWDPDLYGGKESLYISSDQIWTPLLYLLYTPDEMKSVGEDIEYVILILHDGTVSYSPGGVMNTKCDTDVSRFPFDVQTCSLNFVTWGIASDILILLNHFNYAGTEYYVDNPDWKLINTETYAYDEGGYLAKITIKRNSFYYVIMVILPMMLFSILNPLVFLLPTESGERMSLAISILLSYAIFLTIMSSTIPATSNPICYLLVAMIAIIFVSGIIIILLIISAAFYYEEKVKISNCYKLVLKFDDRRDMSNNEYLSGKQMSKILDKQFIVISYSLLTVVMLTLFILIVN